MPFILLTVPLVFQILGVAVPTAFTIYLIARPDVASALELKAYEIGEQTCLAGAVLFERKIQGVHRKVGRPDIEAQDAHLVEQNMFLYFSDNEASSADEDDGHPASINQFDLD